VSEASLQVIASADELVANGDDPSPGARVECAGARQRRATEGLASMARPGVFAGFFMAVAAFAERLNLRCARLGNPFVYDNAAFPWAAGIESEWRTIRTELDRVLLRKDEIPNVQDLTVDAAAISRDAGWKIFVLVAYGIKSRPNIELCPETWRIVRQIPGLKTAMFSVFEPGKRLPPHRGPYNGVLRLHLGLLVREPGAGQAIRIGPELRDWQEGRVLIFDDAHEHEAWNETGHPRVVLFVDFVKPLRFPANVVNRVLLKLAVFTPYLREGTDNLRRWERQFHTAPAPHWREKRSAKIQQRPPGSSGGPSKGVDVVGDRQRAGE
jgi:aspartyl/asparaginyl beta-hydroxylase (cupin superfamily)